MSITPFGRPEVPDVYTIAARRAWRVPRATGRRPRQSRRARAHRPRHATHPTARRAGRLRRRHPWRTAYMPGPRARGWCRAPGPTGGGSRSPQWHRGRWSRTAMRSAPASSLPRSSRARPDAPPRSRGARRTGRSHCRARPTWWSRNRARWRGPRGRRAPIAGQRVDPVRRVACRSGHVRPMPCGSSRAR